MSEFKVVVVEIQKIDRVPNSDNLSITQVMNAYPCIFRSGEFQPGDKAVYVPVDALVPLIDDRWHFLRDAEKPKFHAKIKAKKIRGIFSMGILTKADPSWEVGTNVQELLKIEKYEPPPEFGTGGENESDPGYLPCYTDIEGLRKYKHLLIKGEDVCLTEKTHGANGRFVYRDGRLWVGSHHNIKREDYSNLWWLAAKQYDLATKLQQAEGIVFYGEVYGQVQDLKYNAKQGQVFLAFFDAFDYKIGKYLDVDDFALLLDKLKLPMVPVIYMGPWDEELLMPMCEGKSIYPGVDHIREGFVVRPKKERWNPETRRTIFKMVGTDYLLRKQNH